MNIVNLGMEILVPGFSEPARAANFRGGWGILTGDEARGFARLIGSGSDIWSGSRVDFIVPLYH